MFYRLLFFLLFLLLPLKLHPEQSNEVPLITVTPQAYTKTVVRIPNFEGDSRGELSSLVRSLINLHLFCVALEEPPLPGLRDRAHFLRGSLSLKDGLYHFQGELNSPHEGKAKMIRLEATSRELLAYALADLIVEEISPYKGQSKTRIAFVKRDKAGDTLYVMDFSRRNLKKIKSAELILFPKFSPSGKKLAYVYYNGKDLFLEIYEFAKGDSKVFRIPGLSSTPVWMPNERELILTLGRDGEINLFVFNLDRAELNAITSGRGIHQAGSVSPDGKLVAFVGDRTGRPHIYILNLENRKIERISAETNYHTSPRFSPKGEILIYLSQRAGKNELILYNFNKREKKRLVLPYSLSDPAFSPSGDYLIFTGKTRNGTGLYLLHLDSLIVYPYMPAGNLHYPDWGRFY